MTEDIYDPLDEYAGKFRPRFEQVAKETFAQLAREANVNVAANRETCRLLDMTEDELGSVKSSINWTTFLCVVLWCGLAVGGWVLYSQWQVIDSWYVVGIGLAMVVALILLLAKVHPRLSQLKDERDNLQDKAEQYKAEAWRQMEPLNRLYDWDVLMRMMTQTVPRLEFDPYFTTQRLADLQEIYGWDGSFNKERSVIYSHSGLINGNPFVLCRTRKMEMGSKTYQGSKTIHWTTRERGSDGKMQTVHHSQTLIATVTAPYPEYYEKTRLIYGNTAGPDLKFYRQQSGMANREGSLSYKWKRRKLRNKARDLDNSDFAMLTNEEFEVAFDTSNRNNNQQYAMLFTPLAQSSMLKLLRDQEVGYGDDFDFGKNCMINTIISDHIQSMDLDMDPRRYHNYNYDQAERDFYTLNAGYFRAIYFCLAPLLCVPMYQQIRSQQDIYGRDMQRRSAFWEHEALANFWGQDRFKHPRCVTDCILKTQSKSEADGNTRVTVFAHGYRVEKRVTYVSKWGGDGRTHQVPVYWDEYLPVTGQGSMHMQEDNSREDPATTQRQRLDHIAQVLDRAGMSVYRRHIASKI